MSCYDTNIYKVARLKAGKTQEGAAEALGISVESLKAYESYSRLPPAGVVDRMCVVYDALYLAYQHNRIASGDVKVIPEIEVLDLPRASIRLINRAVRGDRGGAGRVDPGGHGAEGGGVEGAARIESPWKSVTSEMIPSSAPFYMAGGGSERRCPHEMQSKGHVESINGKCDI